MGLFLFHNARLPRARRFPGLDAMTCCRAIGSFIYTRQTRHWQVCLTDTDSLRNENGMAKIL